MILINGAADNRIEITDRSLHYGDGVFETIAHRNGQFEFLDSHLTRLLSGCKKLKINFQQLDELCVELKTISEALAHDAVVKVIISRGQGGRGYLANKDILPTRIISTHPYPNYPQSHQQQGVAIRFCQHRLSENKLLAGLKHLNRLDQVLARNEWDDHVFAEGLMLDQSGCVIEGTMTNIFIVKNGGLITPLLDKSGVEGVMKAEIIKLATQYNMNVEMAELKKTDLERADEIFVCNSVNGIWPVIHIDSIDNDYSVGLITKQLQYGLLEMQK